MSLMSDTNLPSSVSCCSLYKAVIWGSNIQTQYDNEISHSPESPSYNWTSRIGPQLVLAHQQQHHEMKVSTNSKFVSMNPHLLAAEHVSTL